MLWIFLISLIVIGGIYFALLYALLRRTNVAAVGALIAYILTVTVYVIYKADNTWLIGCVHQVDIAVQSAELKKCSCCQPLASGDFCVHAYHGRALWVAPSINAAAGNHS